MTMQTALISVSNKTGVTELALRLHARGVRLLSTGGTAQILRDIGLPVVDVSEVTGFPEALGGRVKTLHPHIHAGILARRHVDEDMAFLEEHEIQPIDIVVINLYPFRETLARDDVSYDLAIENIDIGGPALIRAAAKNHDAVTVLCDPEDYGSFLDELESEGEITSTSRFGYASKAFEHTAAYDAVVARYLREQSQLGASNLDFRFPQDLTWTYRLDQELPESAYAPRAALYREASPVALSAAGTHSLQGAELSAAEYVSIDVALAVLEPYLRPAVCAVHRRTILGVAYGSTIHEAWEKLFDQLAGSLDGALLAFNQAVDATIAHDLAGISISAVLTQYYAEEALEILEEREDLQVLNLPDLDVKTAEHAGQAQTSPVRHGYVKPFNRFGLQAENRFFVRPIERGVLVAEHQTELFRLEDFEIASEADLQEGDFGQIEAALSLMRQLTSTACVIWKDEQSLSLSSLQADHGQALDSALHIATSDVRDALLIFDQPLADPEVVERAAAEGIRLITEPGFGDARDDDVIEACDRAGITLCFTGTRK